MMKENFGCLAFHVWKDLRGLDVILFFLCWVRNLIQSLSEAFSILDWLRKKNTFWSIWNCFACDCPISEGAFAPLNRTGRPTQQPSCWHMRMYQALKMWVMSTKITACYVCYSVKWIFRVAEACVSMLRVSGSAGTSRSDLHLISFYNILLWGSCKSFSDADLSLPL